jgi:hypothetical protein
MWAAREPHFQRNRSGQAGQKEAITGGESRRWGLGGTSKGRREAGSGRQKGEGRMAVGLPH